MRNKKILFVLIPVLVVVLVLIAGIVFVVLNNNPEKIFKESISKVLESFEKNQEEYTTVKGTMTLTANVESDNEEMQAVKTMLEGSSIGLNMEADTEKFIVKEDINVTVSNESILNASILLQEQKGYVYLKDWLDKYLELPAEDMDYAELTEYYDNLATLDQDKLMEAIEEELISAISKQEITKEKKILNLDGQKVNVKASVLSLKGDAILIFTKDFITNLKVNEKFQMALGNFKEDINLMIDEMIQTLDGNSNQDVENNNEFRLEIYTKGFLNEFVGVAGKALDITSEQTTGLDILKYNNEKYELVAYDENKGEKVEALKITVENKKENKNKGTATITIIEDEEPLVVMYNYEKKDEQKIFEITTEIEGMPLSVSGNIVEKGKNIKGNLVVSAQEKTKGKINLNCAYDFTYDVEVQKVDIQNSVLIDELSEEDQTTLMTNIQKSKAFEILKPIVESMSVNNTLYDHAQDAAQKTEEALKKEEELFQSAQESLNQLVSQVTYGGFTVKYNVPNGFEVSEYSSGDFKKYDDGNYNSVEVSIERNSVDEYMKDLDDSYVLTSDFYENQKITDLKTYNVNGKEYKFRTITYSDTFGSYVNLYFAYELDDEYCYVMEVESEGGQISMDTLKYFLDVTVELSDLKTLINTEKELGSGIVEANGVYYNSIGDYVNSVT